MPPENGHRCKEPDCDTKISHKKNICRHLRTVHGKQTRRQGRPKKIIADLAGSHYDAPLGALRRPQPARRFTGDSCRSSEGWWAHQPATQGRPYHWNRNGLLQRLLQLPCLGQQETLSEHGLARIMSPSELPTKSEADALLAFHNHKPELKFYSNGQYDDAGKNEKYPGEFYDTLLFNLSISQRFVEPRYAKVPLDEAEFDYSRAHIDRDFLYSPQQAEIFASPAGSWSDIHIDHFLAGLAVPVGDTVKLFACWPACEHNLKLLDQEPPGPERLAHILDRLDGGHSAFVTRDSPLYLSSGCLHAVVTLQGGFMYAGNFMTAGNGPGFLRSLRHSPAFVGRYDEAGRRGLMENLIDQVEIALERSSCWTSLLGELIESWPFIERVGQKADKKRIAQHLLRLMEDPRWQRDRAEHSSIDMVKLESIMRSHSHRFVRRSRRCLEA